MAKFDTKLLPEEETAFQAWKARLAPKDSGNDYDLRGAFKANVVPDPATGHWPDTYKKPNHPSFSPESVYHPQNPANAVALKAAGVSAPPAGGSIAAATPGAPLSSISPEAQARILGTKTTSRQTQAQKADQAAFDSRFTGGQFTPSAPGRMPWAGDVAPATRAPAQILTPKPTVDSIYKPTVEPAYQPSSNVYTAPANVQMTTPLGGPAATAGVNPTPIPGQTPSMMPNLAPPGVAPTATPSATPVPVPTPGTGRTTEAGVSRSQAATIQQPTSVNPVPVTPTSPVLDVNDFDKKKVKFAGF